MTSPIPVWTLLPQYLAMGNTSKPPQSRQYRGPGSWRSAEHLGKAQDGSDPAAGPVLSWQFFSTLTCRLARPYYPKTSSSDICAPFWTLLAVKVSSMYWSLVPEGSGIVTVLPVDGFQV
jgi:hypothetical protein